MSMQSTDPEQLVRSMFTVKQSFALPGGELEFQIAYAADTKGKFSRLHSELLTKGYRPELTGTKDDCVLTLKKAEPAHAKASRFTVILALLTLASIVVFALAEVLNYEELAPSVPSYFVFIGFSAGTALIVGAHELGQRLLAKRRNAGHANSYLIPWLPFLPPAPSLGFATAQREPAVNRDGLFDTVIAGPLAILALAIVIYIIGDLSAAQSTLLYQWAHGANATKLTNPNVIEMSVDLILGPVLPKTAANALAVSPLADAATVGFILVFIGLLPMAFFDGGFLSALAGGPGLARVTSYLSVIALMVLDTPTYWALAVLVLLLAGRPFQPRLLDEVSELSWTRKSAFALSVAVAFLCLPIPHNLATLWLP